MCEAFYLKTTPIRTQQHSIGWLPQVNKSNHNSSANSTASPLRRNINTINGLCLLLLRHIVLGWLVLLEGWLNTYQFSC